MTIPNWWQFLLLAFAAWRTFRLIAEDTILDGPRRWLVRLPRKWQDGDSVPKEYRTKWATFITCPYCAGFHISVAWWVAFQISERWSVMVAVPFAMSALVALVAVNLDREEE